MLPRTIFFINNLKYMDKDTEILEKILNIIVENNDEHVDRFTLMHASVWFMFKLVMIQTLWLIGITFYLFIK